MIIVNNGEYEEILTDFDTDSFNEEWGKNNNWSINFDVIKTTKNAFTFELIQQESQVKYNGQWFVIKNFEPTANGKILKKSITAHHIYFTCQDHRQYNQKSKTWSIKDALAWTFDGNKLGFTWEVVGTFSNVEIENFGDANALSMINEICEKFGAVVEANNKHLIFYSENSWGKTTHNQFRYLYNTDTVRCSIDTTNFKTVIRGYGKPVEETDIFDSWVALGINKYYGEEYYDQDSNTYQMRGLNKGFRFNFDGTGFKIKLITHFLGGRWEFTVDGKQTKTITTYANYAPDTRRVYKDFEIFRGLENKTHTVVVKQISRDGNNPYTKGTGTDTEPIMIMPEGASLGLYRQRVGDDELYVFPPVEVKSTEENIKKYGLRIQEPIRDERFTSVSSMTNHLKKQLHDYPDISLSITAKRKVEINRGDKWLFIYEPMGIDTDVQIVGYRKFPYVNKAPEVTFSNTRKAMNDIQLDIAKAAKNATKKLSDVPGLVRTNIPNDIKSSANVVSSVQQALVLSSRGIFSKKAQPQITLMALDNEEEITDPYVGITDDGELVGNAGDGEHTFIDPDGINANYLKGEIPQEIKSQFDIPKYELVTSTHDGLMRKEDFIKMSRILFSGSEIIDLQEVINKIDEYERRIAVLEEGLTDV